MSDQTGILEEDFDDEDVELDIEAPVPDAVDQHIELLPNDEVPVMERTDSPIEPANPADAAEQARVVQLDEDDYR
jgi:hypothetical protein